MIIITEKRIIVSWAMMEEAGMIRNHEGQEQIGIPDGEALTWKNVYDRIEAEDFWKIEEYFLTRD